MNVKPKNGQLLGDFDSIDVQLRVVLPFRASTAEDDESFDAGDSEPWQCE